MSYTYYSDARYEACVESGRCGMKLVHCTLFAFTVVECYDASESGQIACGVEIAAKTVERRCARRSPRNFLSRKQTQRSYHVRSIHLYHTSWLPSHLYHTSFH
jgi:hypothetical protein